jgi:F-type H+-transporting ATPase subunit alpha
MSNAAKWQFGVDQIASQALRETPSLPYRADLGQVLSVGSGIARVGGLSDIRAEELVEFEGGAVGVVLDLGVHDLGVMLISEDTHLSAGQAVKALGRIADTPVGEGLLGRVVDATGAARDGAGAVASKERWPVERAAPSIMARSPVQKPLQTGLKAVDALVPVGRGQRELIVGDRQTGKTAIALAALLNQADTQVIGIYCAIGQRGTSVARVIDDLKHGGVFDQSIVMTASGEDPPGLQFITPYAAMTLAEYFRDQGHDVLLVFDDLTRHARAYRELSLLLRRPPGREAFPGDIFYIHSRLLERATHLRDDRGGGSITALPIVETQAQDLSAYIPTNLVSITDGQIYLSPNLFQKGLMPAVDVGRSVSRVGGKTQLPAYRVVAGDLRLAYAQFEELETFSRFATRLDEQTQQAITRGQRVRELLRQNRLETLSVPKQIIALRAVNLGLFDDVDSVDSHDLEAYLRESVSADINEIMQRMSAGETLADEDWEKVDSVLSRLASEWRSREGCRSD